MTARDAHTAFVKLALACGVLVAGVEAGWVLLSPLPYDWFGNMMVLAPFDASFKEWSLLRTEVVAFA